MANDGFPLGVADKLGWYVYRLTDPLRNDETFYVGKGQGDRIFAHVRGAVAEPSDSDVLDLKTERIRQIHEAGLDVGHVVHRHGIIDQVAAYEVEAALIDAYPDLTNRAGGHGSGDRGPRTVLEVIGQYETEEFEVREPLLLVTISKGLSDDPEEVYHAARFAWTVSLPGVEGRKLVLAQSGGIVVGAFRWDNWLEGTRENFPDLGDEPKRWGFRGRWADSAERDSYVGKRVPSRYRGWRPWWYCDPK